MCTVLWKLFFCTLFYSCSSVKSLGNAKNTNTNVQCYRHLGHKLHSSFKDAVKMRSLGASLSCVVQKDQAALLPHLELCTFTSKASVLWASSETSHFRAMIRGLLGEDTELLWLNFSTMDWLWIQHAGGNGALTSLCSPQTHSVQHYDWQDVCLCECVIK